MLLRRTVNGLAHLLGSGDGAHQETRRLHKAEEISQSTPNLTSHKEE